MVKYGGHIEAVREGDNASTDLFLVSYNEIKDLIFQSPSETEKINGKQSPFEAAWKESLSVAEADFQRANQQTWASIFQYLGQNADAEKDVRGAHPGNALHILIDSVHPSKAQEILLRMTQIHRAAGINAEGLRKLVKKYDKYKQTTLSLTLLPALYTSTLYAGQQMLLDGIHMLRALLEESAGGNSDQLQTQKSNGNYKGFVPVYRHDSETRHQQAAELRLGEFDWLKRLVNSILESSPVLLPRMVAHRGFHHIKDRPDKRPIENSLSAYEMAWSAGVFLCECDIALTKDEKLVLAHDENFMRLALDSRDPNSNKKVSDLTFRELISMPLRSGVRPPLLIDVLRSAIAISEKAQLVIEIKPGNEAAASALARMLVQHQELRKAVAMIMSFDVVTMHLLRAELSAASEAEAAAAAANSTGLGARITSLDHFGTMTSYLGVSGSAVGLSAAASYNRSLNALGNTGQQNDSSIGLSISSTNLMEKETIDGSSSVSFRLAEEKQEVPSKLPTHPITSAMPKLMLLTVSDPPLRPCEMRVSVQDLSAVHSWLSTPTLEGVSFGSLDGVYLQFEHSMMTPEGAEKLRDFAKEKLVGIWGWSGRDPDDFQTFQWLVEECRCTFVNTDLPNHFKKDIMVRTASS